METLRHNGTLRIGGIADLNREASRALRGEISTMITPDVTAIDIDLSQTVAVDSAGLGGLLALRQTAHEIHRTEKFPIRLLNPQPTVLQIFELTRMPHFFEIVHQTEPDPGTPLAPTTPAPDEIRPATIHLH